MSRARAVYDQSNGDVTKCYYGELQALGPIGIVAMNLFRAHKASTRAKLYRGHAIGDAYQKKQWSLGLLVEALQRHAAELRITFGWKADQKTIMAGQRGGWILYIDLPTGQVSFHTPDRGAGPDYAGDWDRQRLSDVRIIRLCDNVMGTEPEDLRELLKQERQKPVRARSGQQARRAAAGRQGRLDALAAEIARQEGAAVRHVEQQAEFHEMQQLALL